MGVSKKEARRRELECLDHSELVEIILNIEETAITDFLTGLYNRRYFEKKVSRLLFELSHKHERRSRGIHSAALLFIDIDHFKEVNDSCGHCVGDQVLRGVAQLLQTSVRAHDIVARWGGEEFVIYLSGIEECPACAKAERLRMDIESLEHLVLSSKITVSIGVAVTQASLSLEKFVDLADRAMYEAKQLGRNRVISAHNLDPHSL